MLGANFTFIERTILRPGVLPTAPEFRTGCDCPDAEDCMYDSCKCLDEVDEDDQGSDLDDEDREVIEWWEAQRRQQERARQRGSRDGSRDVPGPASSRAAQAQASRATNASRRSKKRFAYHSKGHKAGLLRGSQLDSPAAIYECHEGCQCDKASCPNRIVERGRQVPLQIFRTEDGRGWGK